MAERKKFDPAVLYEWDRLHTPNGQIICGVDEAGRGPLAGDVYAAAVILRPDAEILTNLNDSKKLSEKKRDALYDEIIASALSWSVASASVAEIEELNILQATLLAMRRAVEGLSVQPNIAYIDGNRPPILADGIQVETVVKGDATSASISAASILAKVTRDRTLYELDQLYPQYGFAKHKGYGTKEHRDAILEYGPSPVHRMSFLKNLYK